MEITPDKLVQIIGTMYIEMTMMRAEIERLQRASGDKHVQNGGVAPPDRGAVVNNDQLRQ